MSFDDEPRRRIDAFDRILGQIEGMPNVPSVRPSTVLDVMPIIGQAVTFVVQTYKEDDGFIVFLQRVDAEGGIRIAIPPKVAQAIYRQRDALVKASRRQTGRDRWSKMGPAERREAIARLRKPKEGAEKPA